MQKERDVMCVEWGKKKVGYMWNWSEGIKKREEEGGGVDPEECTSTKRQFFWDLQNFFGWNTEENEVVLLVC